MKTKEILVAILDDLQDFESSSADLTFDSFLNYLFYRHKSELIEFNKFNDEISVPELVDYKEDNASRDVSILVTFMYKYAKNYIKKALENSVINTPDEFAFLITILTSPGMPKTALINKLVTEKTSGVETIKRLLKKNLLEEFKNSEDKKSVYVRITDYGRACLFEVLPLMNKVSKIITGNLSEGEIKVLTTLLVKLDNFHNDIFFDSKMNSINEIFESKISG